MNPADKIEEIGLRRGMCYGSCPVYKVTLQRSGSARFEGEYFVNMMGTHIAAMDPADFARLAEAAVNLNFRAFAPKYASEWTDQATTSTWVATDGHRQQVEDYGEAGPNELREFEELIDEVASRLDWRPERSAPVGDVSTFSHEAGAHWTQRPLRSDPQ